MNKDDENKAVQQPAAAEESSQQPAAEQDSGLPKTQEELDALIEQFPQSLTGTEGAPVRQRPCVSLEMSCCRF